MGVYFGYYIYRPVSILDITNFKFLWKKIFNILISSMPTKVNYEVRPFINIGTILVKTNKPLKSL
jgi:hypothetical protein